MNSFWKMNELHEISDTDIQMQLVRNFEPFMQAMGPLLPNSTMYTEIKKSR